MKTILEIQKLDRQIRALNREVDRCPASMDFNKYKRIMQEGKSRYEELEKQASEIIKIYNKSLNKFNEYKGNSEILRKRNTDSINLDNASNLLSESNNMVGELSEENKRIDEIVRKSEEIVRRTVELTNKLTEAKKHSNIIKEKIEQKRNEIAPKVAEIQAKIKELEPNIKDTEKYAKYNEMKEKGIFPVFVGIEDVFCGGCKVELSLNFIEKLKTSKMLPCEHCGRIIMFK